MDRLSSLDASFLRVETESAHMHVGWSATLELPPGRERLDVGAVSAQIESRLHLVPRFRQQIRGSASGLGPPSWIDAPDFRLEDHVTVESGPLDCGALRRRTDEFFSAQLHRDRPLWQLHLIPRLSRRRAAVLGKVHHAMVDGMAAVQLGLLLFDASPDFAAPGLPESWVPRRTGSLRLAIDEVRDTAVEQLRLTRQAAQLGLNPGRGVRLAQTMRRAAFGLADDLLNPAPESHLNPPIGPRRRLVGTGLPIARLNAVKQASQSKLNDVLLATVAGALERLALAEGRDPEDVRVMIPANVRREQAGAQGNAISFMFVDLPVRARPSERLALVAERTRAVKEAGRVAGSHQVMQLMGLLPGPVQGQAARLVSSPRLYNLTVSNVPGPPVTLYVGGCAIRTILPVIPIPDQHALSIGALSYGGQLHLSAYSDPDALPSAGRLPAMLGEAFEEIRLANCPARA